MIILCEVLEQSNFPKKGCAGRGVLEEQSLNSRRVSVEFSIVSILYIKNYKESPSQSCTVL